MGFAPLDDEVELFYEHAKKESLESELSFEELVSILKEIRDNLNEKAKKSVNYSSYGAYTFDCYHHRSAASRPNTVFKSPATKGMSYGFYDFKNINLNNVHRPIRKCPETLYAESQVRLGYGK